jgi:hypothetical protein
MNISSASRNSVVMVIEPWVMLKEVLVGRKVFLSVKLSDATPMQARTTGAAQRNRLMV